MWSSLPSPRTCPLPCPTPSLLQGPGGGAGAKPHARPVSCSSCLPAQAGNPQEWRHWVPGVCGHPLPALFIPHEAGCFGSGTESRWAWPGAAPPSHLGQRCWGVRGSLGKGLPACGMWPGWGTVQGAIQESTHHKLQSPKRTRARGLSESPDLPLDLTPPLTAATPSSFPNGSHRQMNTDLLHFRRS